MRPMSVSCRTDPARGAGQGFCYDFGRGINAFFPTLVGLLSAKVALGTAIGMFARFLMRLSSLPRLCCRKRGAGNFRQIEKIQLSLATS
jgi:hypothetical protein